MTKQPEYRKKTKYLIFGLTIGDFVPKTDANREREEDTGEM